MLGRRVSPLVAVVFVGVALLGCFETVSAECPHFAAWLSQPSDANLASSATAFATFDLSTDRKRATVSLHLDPGASLQSEPTKVALYKRSASGPVGTELMDLPRGSCAHLTQCSLDNVELLVHGNVELIDAALSSQLYIGIRTVANPNDELRAYFEPSNCYDAFLMSSGSQLRRGYAAVIVKAGAASTSAAVRIRFAGDVSRRLSSPVVNAALSVNGNPGVYQNFGSPPLHFVGAPEMSRALIDAVTSGSGRVNVSTSAHPAGELFGDLAAAQPCQHVTLKSESLFSIARSYGTDWLSVWSLNSGNPDVRRQLHPVMYAHPYKISAGETIASVGRRFALMDHELYALNPLLVNATGFSAEEIICVVPNWKQSRDRMGRRVCSA